MIILIYIKKTFSILQLLYLINKKMNKKKFFFKYKIIFIFNFIKKNFFF
jgi:hypothetical protein